MLNLVRLTVKIFLNIIFRIKVINKENMPKSGAVIVCFNHRSNWDVPVVASCLSRPLNFMAKKELFDIFLLGSFIRWSGAFPVSRGKGDIAAIKAAVGVLKQEKTLAIFPEGKRVKDGQPHNAKAGVALIAEKTGAAVLPIGISGRYLPFHKITLNIGSPIQVKCDGKADVKFLQSEADKILDTILSLAGEKQ